MSHSQKHAKKLPLPARIAIGIGVGLVGLVVVAALLLVLLLNTDVLPDLRDQYVLMTYHTSNPWLCTAFAPASTIDRILEENKAESPEGQTDTGLIHISTTETTDPSGTTGTAPTSTAASTIRITTASTKPGDTTAAVATVEEYPGEVIYSEPGLDILEIKQPTFVARLVRVADPKRVSLGVAERCSVYHPANGSFGEKLVHMCERTDSLIGINAGGFSDPNGGGNGGIPSYLLVTGHELKYWDDQYTKQNVIGLTDEGVLLLGAYTKEEVADMAANGSLKEATSFKPFLLVNGVMGTFSKAAGGRDPRTSIGQCADGTILLLTCDGRQPGMEGANQRDSARIMQAYGAVNAANLDGGSSTTMVLNNVIINKTCSLYGPRYLNTAFLVSKLPPEAAAETEEPASTTEE